MKRFVLITMLVLSALPSFGQATCFAHTSVQLGGTQVSAPMDDTGATMLIAFTTAYGGYTTIKDVAGGPNTWYHVGNWGIGSLTGTAIMIAINPITNTAAKFVNASGQVAPGSDAAAQIWACKGVNTTDLFYQSTGLLVNGNGPNALGAAVGPTDTTLTIRTVPTPIHNGDYGHMQSGAVQEYFLVTDASNPSSLIVQRGQLGTTAQSWPVNQAMFIGFGVGLQTCMPPAAIGPAAVGDLEFIAAGRAGVGSPVNGSTTATINVAGFSTPVVIGGLATGTAGTVAMSWRVATDMSTTQPTLTMSASDQWTCIGLVIKASTTPAAPEPNPHMRTVVGNGYQCTNPGSSGSDCPSVAPGDGGNPLGATLNWPSEMVWYKHGVPANKVLVFVDNQANLLRAVNFDTVPHTVANVVINPGVIKVIAGTGAQNGPNGSCTGNGGPALSATMMHPVSLAEDPTTGNLAVGDQQCGSIDVIDTAGNFHWAAGGGTGGTTSINCGVQARHGNRVNVPATQALFVCPQGNAYDINGNMIVGDTGNDRIVFVNNQSTPVNAYGVTGIQPGYAVTIAGSGTGCFMSYTPQPALSTPLSGISMGLDRATGDIYFGGEICHQIGKLTADGHLVLVAGIDVSSTGGTPSPAGHSPDGTAANTASFSYIFRATKEADGLIHFTDTNANEIRHIDASGNLVTEAGNYARWGGKANYSGGGWYGDNGSMSRFELNYPVGFLYDSTGNLCVPSLMSNIIACEVAGPVIPLAGTFIAAASRWVSGTQLGGGSASTSSPIYGGPGAPGANSTVTLGPGTSVTLSTGDVIPRLQTIPETVGQSWTFTVSNKAIYLVLFGGYHTFIDGNNPNIPIAFNPPVAVTVGGVAMFMYQTTHALYGSYKVKIGT